MSANPSQPVETKPVIDISDYEFSGDNYTVERKRTFLVRYHEHGSIVHAARATPVSRKCVYLWLEQDEEFAQALADIKEGNTEVLETSVYKRAFSDSLLAMFWLKAHKPQYRDKVQVDLNAVQSDIDDLMQRVGQKQLPVATTSFIDTDYSTSENEHFPVPSQLQQKEESES